MMDPTSSVHSRPKSFNEGLRSASEHQSLREAAEEDSSPPAMLTTTQTTAAGSASSQIPGPFQPANQQYARNPTSRMITSASEPAISAAAQNGEQRIRATHSKIDTIKNWSISTYKCTKQLMFEKLGKTSRTVDTELEQRIEHLRELKRKYLQVLGLSRAFTSHFYHVIQTQQALSDVFAELAQKSPELQEEFLYNAETQRNLHKNGEILLSALNFFLSSVNTLCNKTIEDTILTIRQYENSRLEYDAYRSDLELMLQVPKTEANAARIEESQHNFSLYKQAYEKLRDDVNIKLQFLDENRIKVMHKQLLLFHNAISAYFSGNQQSLEATIKQFCIKPLTPNSTKPSWLEQQ